GVYDEMLKGQGAEDLELWLRMLYRGHRFEFSRDPLVHYRWRQNSLSNSGVGLMKCVVSVYEKLLTRYELTACQQQWVKSCMPEIRARLDFAFFKDTIAKGNYTDAARHLANANLFYRRPKFTAAQILMKFAPGIVAKAAR